jgi:dTDP-4-amino-4,6-dideoxygalactose transaminase
VVREAYLEVGYNYRLTDIQAAVGIAQLRRLPGILEDRRRMAARYDAGLSVVPSVQAPVRPPGVTWNVQTYAIRLEGFDAAMRDGVMQDLLDQGIATRPGVMTAHREPAYASRRRRLPASEAASDGSLVLPMHGGLRDEDLDSVVRVLTEAVERWRKPSGQRHGDRELGGRVPSGSNEGSRRVASGAPRRKPR